jgi:SNF2 family DNA or RNA helicase
MTTEELERLVKTQKPFVRLPDGRFVEWKNQEEVKDFLEVLALAKAMGKGVYQAHLERVPELLAVIGRAHSAKLQATNEAFTLFLEEMEQGKSLQPLSLPPSLEAVLRPYQKQGVAWMEFLSRYHFGGVLADDMGLGKTLQVLSWLALRKAEGRLTHPALVVCPKTLLLAWRDEAQKFTPDLSLLVVDGLLESRKQIVKQMSAHDVVITSYSLLQRDILQYVEEQNIFSALILDEAQYIKNAQTGTAKAVKLLRAPVRLALTGTPLENGVRELWSIFDFLLPGFLGTAAEFRERYEKLIRDTQDTRALHRLKGKIKPFLLRRTKTSELKELPPKTEQTVHAMLTAEQVVVYSRVLEEVRIRIEESVKEKGFVRSRVEILSALMRLRRLCDHPALVDERLPREEALSGKLATAMELVRQAHEGGHKVLFFSQFTTMLDMVREGLDRLGIGHCTIEGRTRDRATEVKRFQEDPAASVFLLSLKAGGTGLTLTEADTVILFDPWWNPQVEKQAMDRAHRIGQQKPVNVYKLVTQGTIEEKVMALQEKKRAIFDALMEETSGSIEALTWDDVKSLLE